MIHELTQLLGLSGNEDLIIKSFMLSRAELLKKRLIQDKNGWGSSSYAWLYDEIDRAFGVADKQNEKIMLDVEMLPTQHLLDELMKRCVPAIFIGTKYEGEGNDRSFKNFQSWKGNLDTCRGMCHEMDSMLQREMIREEREYDKT